MRKWLRHQLWNMCWEIGDTFMGWSFKFDDSDTVTEIQVTSAVPVTVATGTSTTATWK